MDLQRTSFKTFQFARTLSFLDLSNNEYTRRFFISVDLLLSFLNYKFDFLFWHHFWSLGIYNIFQFRSRKSVKNAGATFIKDQRKRYYNLTPQTPWAKTHSRTPLNLTASLSGRDAYRNFGRLSGVGDDANFCKLALQQYVALSRSAGLALVAHKGAPAAANEGATSPFRARTIRDVSQSQAKETYFPVVSDVPFTERTHSRAVVFTHITCKCVGVSLFWCAKRNTPREHIKLILPPRSPLHSITSHSSACSFQININ